jgi:thymidylate synthase
LINNVASLFFIETYENHEEKQYLTAIKNILENGYDWSKRTNRSIFGDCSMKFSLKKRKNAYTDDEKNGLENVFARTALVYSRKHR